MLGSRAKLMELPSPQLFAGPRLARNEDRALDLGGSFDVTRDLAHRGVSANTQASVPSYRDVSMERVIFPNAAAAQTVGPATNSALLSR